MKKITLLAFCLMLTQLGACISPAPDSAPPTPPISTTPPFNDDVVQIDKEINQIEQEIQETREIVRAMHLASVLAIQQDADSRGWVRGLEDHYDPLKKQAARNAADALAGEQMIKKLRQKLARKQQEREELLNQSAGCFLPDTLVQMADGSKKPFSSIQAGDLIMAYDIGYQKTLSRPVVEIYSVNANHLYTINNKFVTTGGERLLSQKGWRKVSALKVGDQIFVNNQMVKIKKIDYRRENNNLLNMQIADTHNFYISAGDADLLLVHNTGSGGGK